MTKLTEAERIAHQLEVIENLSHLPLVDLRKIKKGSPELDFLGAEAMRVQADPNYLKMFRR